MDCERPVMKFGFGAAECGFEVESVACGGDGVGDGERGVAVGGEGSSPAVMALSSRVNDDG